MRPLNAAPWLLLAGCWVTPSELDAKIAGETDTDTDTDGDTDADTDTDTDADGDIEVVSVDPGYGSATGGQTVTVTASPLEGDVTVTFGGEEGDVLSVDGDEILVEVPPGAEGFADVVVSDDAGSGALSDGFAYWEGAEGRTSAIGEIAWYDYRGDYWGNDPDYGDAWVRLLHPTDLVFADLYGGATTGDKCVTNGAAPDYPATYALSTSMRLVSDGGDSISLPRSGDLYTGSVDDSIWAPGDSWAMELDAVGWPERVEGFLEMPDSLEVTSPYIDGSDVYSLDYVFESFTLQWSGGSPGDYVVATFLRYEGEDVADYVSCTLKDDGSYTVSSSVWTDWITGEQLTIVVGRVELGSGTMPTSGGAIEVGATHYAVGAVWTL